MRNWWARAALGAATFCAVSGVVGATPASSDPFWEEVTVTPQFHCTTGTEPGFYEASTCVIVDGDTARSVAIVTNLADAPITVDAPNLTLYYDRSPASRVYCSPDTLDPGSTRACFGPTISESPCIGEAQTWSLLVIHNRATSYTTSPTRKLCT